MTEKEFVLKFVSNTCGCIDLTSGKAAESVTELVKYAGEIYKAINASDQEEKKEEVDNYQEISKKCCDEVIKYYRNHKEEIDKACHEEIAHAIFPSVHSKRFGETTSLEVIQECIDAYEARIDELVERCNILDADRKDAIRERDEAIITIRDNEAQYTRDMSDKKAIIDKLASERDVLYAGKMNAIRERDELRIAARDNESKCINCGVEHRAAIQELERKVKGLITERDKFIAELRDLRAKHSDATVLEDKEIILINTLRCEGAGAIFIKKENGSSKWTSEYLIQRK